MVFLLIATAGLLWSLRRQRPPRIQADAVTVLEITTETGVPYPISEKWFPFFTDGPFYSIRHIYRSLRLEPTDQTVDPDRHLVVQFYDSQTRETTTWVLDRNGITIVPGLEGTWAIVGECPYDDINGFDPGP